MAFCISGNNEHPSIGDVFQNPEQLHIHAAADAGSDGAGAGDGNMHIAGGHGVHHRAAGVKLAPVNLVVGCFFKSALVYLPFLRIADALKADGNFFVKELTGDTHSVAAVARAKNFREADPMFMSFLLCPNE